MKYAVLLVVFVMCCVCVGQRTIDTPTQVSTFQMANYSDGVVRIFSQGPMLLTVTDKGGKVLLTSYRDGHVEAADPKKIDESAKLFWQLMAKYMPEFCKQEPSR